MGEHSNFQENGSVAVSFEFGKTLTTTVSVIAFGEFDNIIYIDESRFFFVRLQLVIIYASQMGRVMMAESNRKQQFRGVFAANRLPKRVSRYPSAYIVNTDPASKPGTHWVAFYLPS